MDMEDMIAAKIISENVDRAMEAIAKAATTIEQTWFAMKTELHSTILDEECLRQQVTGLIAKTVSNTLKMENLDSPSAGIWDEVFTTNTYNNDEIKNIIDAIMQTKTMRVINEQKRKIEEVIEEISHMREDEQTVKDAFLYEYTEFEIQEDSQSQLSRNEVATIRWEVNEYGWYWHAESDEELMQGKVRKRFTYGDIIDWKATQVD